MSEKNNIVEEKIKKALEIVKPSLRADGGDVEFKSWNEKTGVVQVAMQGMCMGCPMSQITLKEGIEKTIKEEVKEVKSVEQV